MILYSIPDIRLFWSKDPRFLSQFSSGKIATFKPFSKYPPCYKDVSFWVRDSGLHENDFCDVVRDTAGDFVEDVELVCRFLLVAIGDLTLSNKIDAFTHPKTQRKSQCYRINYRSMDR